jgi:ATP-dependent RNA helicase DeaD
LRSLLFIQKIANAKIKKEKLPDAKQVVETKKEKLKNELRSLLNEGNFDAYLELAQELMSEGADAQRLVAAMLQYNFGDELKEENYRDLQQFNSSVDMKGITRLFVAKGKHDGMNPKALVDFLSREANIDPKQIRDVQVFDKFSFINVPFLEAEQLLAVFEKNKRSRKPLITRAKERDGAAGSGKREGGFEKRRNEKGGFRSEKSGFKNEGSFQKRSFDDAKPERKKRENKNLDYLDKKEFVPKKEVAKTESPKTSFSFSDEDLSW